MTNKLTGFTSYQKPGTYTKSNRGASGFNDVGGYRIPTFIGPASELVLKRDVPVVRGSSKKFPIFVEREDISSQLVLGTSTILKTAKAPFVNPDNGMLTDSVQHITLEIDGQGVTPLKIVGENSFGETEIHLPFVPNAGSKAYVSYYYVRRDKIVTDEDLTSQVNGVSSVFYTANKNIVESNDTGMVTNDPQYITVTVNGVRVPVVSLDGAEGKFVLATPPVNTGILKVSYKFKEGKSFTDPLPSKFVHSIVKVGDYPQRTNYVNGVDYSLSSEPSAGDFTFHDIAWGNSYAVTPDQNSSWKINTNIAIEVVDRKIFGELLIPVLSDSSFKTLEFDTNFVITDGEGTGSTLTNPNIGADIFSVYVGKDAYNALPNGATVEGNKVVVRSVDGDNKKIFLQTAVDTKVDNVYVIYHTNSMADDKYLFIKSEDERPDPVNLGSILPAEYQIQRNNYGFVSRIALDDDTIHPYYAESYEDVYVPPTYSSDETLTLTFKEMDAYQLTAYNFTLRTVVASNDGTNDLLTFAFSSLGRDLSSLVGSTVTVTGFDTAENNVVDAEVTSAGIDTLTVIATTAGADEALSSADPSAVMGVKLPSGSKTYKFVVTSDVPSLTGSNTDINTSYENTLRAGLKNNEGIVGEPYIDPVSGVMINLKAVDGWVITPDVTTLTFNITKEGSYSVSNLDSQINLPGLSYKVITLEDINIGETLAIETNNFAGDQPSLGDTYYVSYYHYRLNYGVQIYDKIANVEEDFGKANLENPLSLAAKLAFENGAPMVALKPLEKYTEDSFGEFLNLDLSASEQSLLNINQYKEAISYLGNPFIGGRKPYYIIPLTDDVQVVSHAKLHVEMYSAPEWRSERYLISGFNSNRSDSFVLERAQNLKSERLMLVYPPSLVADLEASDGTISRSIIPGYYICCALGGYLSRLDVLPSEPLTNKTLAGFVDIPNIKNELIKNELAAEGVTIVDFESPVFKVRHAMNTDISDSLTREPTVTFIADYMQLLVRKVLDKYVARPHINSILGEIETTFSGFLNMMEISGIITSYKDVVVEEHPDDPTVVLVSAKYSPVFPINYIYVTFQIEGSIN